MKPRKRPGIAATGGKSARTGAAQSKTLTREQLERMRHEIRKTGSSKAGRGGKRASWNTDYAEGAEYHQKNMPCREDQSLSQDGIRRARKRGH